jgi:hypothetical protein
VWTDHAVERVEGIRFRAIPYGIERLAEVMGGGYLKWLLLCLMR